MCLVGDLMCFWREINKGKNVQIRSSLKTIN